VTTTTLRPSRQLPRRPTRTGARRQKTLGAALREGFAVALAAVMIGVPLWLVLGTSAKSFGQSQQPSLSLPTQWHVASNYSTAYREGDLIAGLAGSLLVVAPSVIVILLLASMAAWVLGRRRGFAASAVYGLLVSGILMPPAVVTIVLELREFHISQTRVGLIAVYVALYLSVSTFFMTGFVRTIPAELEEAARVDGAGPWRIYFSVVLPLLRPVIATAAILVTIFEWNDVFYSFFVLGGSSATTLPLNLFQVASAQLYINNWQLIFAYIVLMSLPLIVVFVVGQRRIVSGLTSGAIK
jgi:raffinose/stachyose/melibiose transport system permease protein